MKRILVSMLSIAGLAAAVGLLPVLTSPTVAGAATAATMTVSFTVNSANGPITAVCKATYRIAITKTLLINVTFVSSTIDDPCVTAGLTATQVAIVAPANAIYETVTPTSPTYSLLFLSTKVGYWLTFGFAGTCTVHFTTTLVETGMPQHLVYDFTNVPTNGSIVVTGAAAICTTVFRLLNTTPTSTFSAVYSFVRT